MAEAKWSGVLSTTEPRNDVGIIKVRQGNINSEIAEFQIVQNNKPYDLTGLTVYFCASFGLNLVEKPAVVINTTGGRIQYTFDDDSMQSVGRQKGYFSINKEESKVDSTQDFEYQVDSSLMTRSIDGKSYIYKLSTLIKVLDDFITNGQNNFDTWFESVKEILYGVDPGGNILGELLEARNKEDGRIFDSLKERLNYFDAQFSQNDNTHKPILTSNQKVPKLTHFMAGIDSLTNGAGGTNWAKYFALRAQGELGDGGLGYIGFNNAAIVNDGHTWSFSGLSSLENLDQSAYPGKYSLDNKGLYADSASGGVITLNLNNRTFKHAKLIYLKQAGGGSFTTRYGTESNSKTVDTSSDGFDLGVVSLNDVAHNGQIFIQNITGKIVLFGIYIYNDEGLIFSKLGKGGDKLLNHSNTDDVFRKKWLEALKPDVFLFNGGTNDRSIMSSTTFDATMRKYLQPFLDTSTQMVLIRPNDINGDITWESYNAKLINYHVEKNTGYINEKELLGGDYSSALNLGYMYDTVHPSDLGNKKRSANYLDYFGISKLGRNLSTVLEYQYKTVLTPKKIDVTGVTKTTLYKLGLINGYPNGMLKLTIKGLRAGSAGMVEKTVYASIRNGTVLNNASFSDFKTVQNYEYRPDTIVTDFIVTVEVVNNLLEISVTPNTGSNNMNFYVEGDVTMLYLPSVGRSVFEN